LWHEQKYKCPYSGKEITQDQLFTRDIEIDHILPYSMSLDNSLNNKVVCFAKENQDKGQRTPFDWIGHDEEKWTIVSGAIDHYNPQRKIRGKRPTIKANMDLKQLAGENKDKWQRFFMTSDQIDEIYWQPRFLPESGHIAREVRDFLKRLYPYKIADQKVITTKGGITYELRKWWDLNRILGNGDQKERSDLRHHALDAAVIACTNRKLIKNITREIQKAWPKKRPSEIYVERPWDSFEDDLAEAISQVNVSHKVQRKVKGQLHKEKFYKKHTKGLYKGKYTIRKTLDSTFKLSSAKRICDNKIRRLVIQKLNGFKNNPKDAFSKPLYITDKEGKNKSKVNKVTIWEDFKDDNMLEIRPKVFVVRPENHHIEIFKRNAGGLSEFRCKTWDMWDVKNRIKNNEQIILKRHPEFPDLEFVMSLSKGETVELNGKNGIRVLARVKEVGRDVNDGKSTDIHFWEVHVATIEGRITKETSNAYRVRSMNDFKNLEIKKVTVDSLGRIRRAND
jgi:CRISPR-associated endonuclease Csn1